MRRIMVISDPENEVGFSVLTSYCEQVQTLFNPNELLVLPFWPSGKIELIDGNDKQSIELIRKTLTELITEFDLEQ